jgi:predicted transcriptional regulator
MKQNVTLAIDKDLLRKVKHVAVERGKSVNALLVEHLSQIVEQDEDYERSRKQAVAVIKRGLKLGGKMRGTRDALHER